MTGRRLLAGGTVITIVVVLGLVAIASISVLQQRSVASRSAQLELAAIKTELNQLQSAPFAEGGARAVLKQMQADQRRIRDTLAKLRRDSPPQSLIEVSAPLQKNFATLGEVFESIGSGRDEEADRLSAVGDRQSAAAARVLADASRDYAHRASRSQQQATVGSAAVILLLLGAFGFLYARSIRARLAVERSEELLDRQRRQLSEAQSVGAIGSWEWDIAANSTEWSAELFRIYGVEPQQDSMAIEDFVEAVHPDDRATVQAEVQAARESGEPFSFEHRIVQRDGTVRIAHARGEVIMGDDGTPVRMLGTAQDITERREVERAKDEFTSVVSHELRTPLTSIRGSLGLLESGVLGPLSEKGQRMVEIAVENTDRLVRLINDILDIERIDSGKIDMHQQPCDAAELIERAIEGVGQVAAEAQVMLVADAQPAALFADPDRVLQTLTNLISNAVKFSPAGSSVHVSGARRDGEVLFEVSDKGRGIPADKLETIFERFQQVDASDSREKGGTGLGLAICRTIVEHHGGRIWAESEGGAGSTFSFVLPGQASNGSAGRPTRDGTPELGAIVL